MRLIYTCILCSETNPSQPLETILPYQQSPYYKLTCINGHKQIIYRNGHEFEMLFELATQAIFDGYHREAVASYASAAERFYEFFLKVVHLHYHENMDSFNSLWKQMNNQSERQLGAYLITYLRETGQCHPKFDTSFRNNVIHKGIIPTKAEAINEGQKIKDRIILGLEVIRSRFNEAALAYTITHNPPPELKDYDGSPIIGISQSKIVGWNCYDPRPLKDIIEQSSHFYFGFRPLQEFQPE